jgi:SAM-dependent methyltransferase
VILELGCHGGYFTERLRALCPQARFVVWDDDRELLELARTRHFNGAVSFSDRLEPELVPQVDIAVSVARHHHLPHDYLSMLARVLKPGGVYVLADELCPEYCAPEDREWICSGHALDVASGYVLTSREEIAAFAQSGRVPPRAIALEEQRKRALWDWYRYVVDEAMTRGYYDVAAVELRSSSDDLVTGSDAEHKFSPTIVARQLALAGFERIEKHSVCPANPIAQQGMFIFECQWHGGVV